MRKLNTLIIGCGNIGGKFDFSKQNLKRPLTHAGAYSNHGGFDLLACVDVDSIQMEAFQKEWGIKESYLPTKLSSLGKGVFDVISICSPIQFHEEHLLTAGKLQPKLVFCEKPLTGKFTKSQEIMHLYEANEILLAVNYTRRWDPELIQLRKDIASGIWGDIRSVIGIYSKGILNNGSHLIDLLIFLFGSISVVHVGKRTYDNSPEDPTISGLLKTSSGIEIHLVAGNTKDYANFELQIVTSVGIVAMENGGLKWRIRKPKESNRFIGYKILDAGLESEGSYDLAMAGAVDNVYRAIINGDALSSTGHTAIEAQHICELLCKISE